MSAPPLDARAVLSTFKGWHHGELNWDEWGYMSPDQASEGRANAHPASPVSRPPTPSSASSPLRSTTPVARGHKSRRTPGSDCHTPQSRWHPGAGVDDGAASPPPGHASTGHGTGPSPESRSLAEAAALLSESPSRQRERPSRVNSWRFLSRLDAIMSSGSSTALEVAAALSASTRTARRAKVKAQGRLRQRDGTRAQDDEESLSANSAPHGQRQSKRAKG